LRAWPFWAKVTLLVVAILAFHAIVFASYIAAPRPPLID
jgi:hypothetical protein